METGPIGGSDADFARANRRPRGRSTRRPGGVGRQSRQGRAEDEGNAPEARESSAALAADHAGVRDQKILVIMSAKRKKRGS